MEMRFPKPLWAKVLKYRGKKSIETLVIELVARFVEQCEKREDSKL